MSGPKKNGPICFFCFKNFLPLSPCERSAPRACWIFQQFGLWKLGQFELLSQHRLQTIDPGAAWDAKDDPRRIESEPKEHHFHQKRQGQTNLPFGDVQEMSFQNSMEKKCHGIHPSFFKKRLLSQGSMIKCQKCCQTFLLYRGSLAD